MLICLLHVPYRNTMYRKKILKVDHKIQSCIIFEKIGLGFFFGGGDIDYRYFCQSYVPHYTKNLKLKKSLQRIRIGKVL